MSLVTDVAENIGATLGAGRAGIPVHGSFGDKGSCGGLHDQGDLVAFEGVIGHNQVLQHQRGDIKGEATMGQDAVLPVEGPAIRIEQGDGEGFGRSRGVLQGKPLVVADISIALGKTGGTHARHRFPEHIGATHGGETAPIGHMAVVEVHLPLRKEGTAAADISRDRWRRLARGGIAGALIARDDRIHIDQRLARGRDRLGDRVGMAIGEL